MQRVNIVTTLGKRVKTAISDIPIRWQAAIYNPVQDGY
jgi:hypothetical protein